MRPPSLTNNYRRVRNRRGRRPSRKIFGFWWSFRPRNLFFLAPNDIRFAKRKPTLAKFGWIFLFFFGDGRKGRMMDFFFFFFGAGQGGVWVFFWGFFFSLGRTLGGSIGPILRKNSGSKCKNIILLYNKAYCLK